MDIRVLKGEKYSVNDKMLFRKVSDETVMAYNPENGDMYELNNISHEIITLLKEKLDGTTIIERLTDEYDADENTIAEDISPMLERLIELKILTIK